MTDKTSLGHHRNLLLPHAYQSWHTSSGCLTTCVNTTYILVCAINCAVFFLCNVKCHRKLCLSPPFWLCLLLYSNFVPWCCFRQTGDSTPGPKTIFLQAHLYYRHTYIITQKHTPLCQIKICTRVFLVQI